MQSPKQQRLALTGGGLSIVKIVPLEVIIGQAIKRYADDMGFIATVRAHMIGILRSRTR